MMRPGSTSIDRRKEVFRALVEVQDQRVGVRESREIISEQFGLTVRQIKKIEDEGVERQWPPL